MCKNMKLMCKSIFGVQNYTLGKLKKSQILVVFFFLWDCLADNVLHCKKYDNWLLKYCGNKVTQSATIFNKMYRKLFKFTNKHKPILIKGIAKMCWI